MKGTDNKSGTDIDLFISLSELTTETLKEIYDKLFDRLKSQGYAPTRQNVSINVTSGGYSVDLVPGKRQNRFAADHSLFRRKADTWTKTNVVTHINHVTAAGRPGEIRILKLWRNQRKLDFPSFYLELTIIAALSGLRSEAVSGNFLKILEYLRDRFPIARVVDPANTNNVISDDLSVADKNKIKAAAGDSLRATNWSQSTEIFSQNSLLI